MLVTQLVPETADSPLVGAVFLSYPSQDADASAEGNGME
jgi:hypothetical protein